MMLMLICWILTIEFMIEIKIVYGNDRWRGPQNMSVPPVRKYNGFSGEFTGSHLAGRHIDKTKNTFPTGTAVTIRGYHNNASPAGHSTRPDGHKSGAGFAAGPQIMSGRSVYGLIGGKGGAGYPAKDVATAATYNRNRSWPDTPNGMPAAFTSPQTVKNVYSTLNPVVPYDITLLPLK